MGRGEKEEDEAGPGVHALSWHSVIHVHEKWRRHSKVQVTREESGGLGRS